MRLYYEIALRSFRRITAYRSAMIAGILTNAFFGAIKCFIYAALYQGGRSVAGYTLDDVISYSWITQSLISIGAAWLSWDLSRSIYSGDVITDLTRPWNFYGYWLSRVLGENVFNLLIRGTITYLIGVLMFQARVPSLDEALAFGAAISLAMFVSCAFSFIVNLTAFWLIENTGVMIIANIMLSFFSGFYLPLSFFPPWLAQVARGLPFQAVTSLPAEVFLGHIRGAAIGSALALQLFWALTLTSVGLLVLRAAVRKVIIQGG